MDEKILRQLLTLGGDLCSLTVEAGWVIWLRTRRIAEGGPAGAREAERMVSEKVQAHRHLLAALIAGRLGTNPVAVSASATRHMLQGVRANRRRLSRG